MYTKLPIGIAPAGSGSFKVGSTSTNPQEQKESSPLSHQLERFSMEVWT
jgi:hypothetical protein